MSKPQVKAELIHLSGFRILKSYFETDFNNEDNPQVSHFGLGVKSESGFNFEDNAVRFRLFIKIKGFDEEDNEVGVRGEYHLEYYFIIENLNEFVTFKNSEDYIVDTLIGGTLAGIAYSTSRGIILDRTQSTDFKGVILPVINPQDLLTEDTYTEM